MWDMAPGFEQDHLPDFTRPVTAECLLCHTGSVYPVGGSLNQFRPPYVGSLGISCDRCHGPVEAHLRSPSRANIVSPARLAPAARDSVCEQCHLSGDVRVANPWRQVSDFQVGEATEDVFTTYIFETANATGRLDQGRQSRGDSYARVFVPAAVTIDCGAERVTTLTMSLRSQGAIIGIAACPAMLPRGLPKPIPDLRRIASAAICPHDRRSTEVIPRLQTIASRAGLRLVPQGQLSTDSLARATRGHTPPQSGAGLSGGGRELWLDPLHRYRLAFAASGAHRLSC